MNLEKYSVVTDDDHTTYEFLSEGPKGTIKKIVFYQELEENIFNLHLVIGTRKNKELMTR